jgi:ABC-type enterochelin transport system substrate-binding protein
MITVALVLLLYSINITILADGRTALLQEGCGKETDYELIYTKLPQVTIVENPHNRFYGKTIMINGKLIIK